MLATQGLKCIWQVGFKSVHPKTIRCLNLPNSLVSPPLSTISSRWTSSESKPTKTPEAKEAEEKKKAKRKETHIALIHPDKTITHTTLEDATKLSNRRDLKLVKVSDYDRKRDSPVYMMMTAAQFREEALSLKKSKKSDDKKGPYKGEKLLALNAKIGDHDLESKTQKLIGWLEKNYEVRVTISANKAEDGVEAQKVFKSIESFVGNQGRILQKRNSGNDIKFQIVPPKVTKTPQNAEAPKTTAE